ALSGRLLRAIPRSTFMARTLGSGAGGMLVEIEDATGHVIQARVFARRRSYLSAVAPAVLAARAIATDRFDARGLVPHDLHVDPVELFAYIRSLGIEITWAGLARGSPSS